MVAFVYFDIPAGMNPADVAKTFAAYSLGSRAFENTVNNSSEYRYGPRRKEHVADAWHIDGELNDIWFHFLDGNRGTLHCRYPAQEPVIEAMVNLFKAQFPARIQK